MRKRSIARIGASVAFAVLGVLPPSPGRAQTAAAGAPGLTASDAREIAHETYIYAYPLVLTEITRRVVTNVEQPKGLRSPMNQIVHARTLPDAAFTDAARPSVDMLQSTMFFDVSKEPMVFSVPDPGERYYLLPLMDMWTDVFASRGKRGAGSGAQRFAVVGPRWQGRLPKGIGTIIRSPTGIVVLTARTQVNGKADAAAAHRFQDGIKAVPLIHYGRPYAPPKGKVDREQDMSAPAEQVERMSAGTFFALAAELMQENPPHANDYPVLARMKRLGLEPGKPFLLAAAPAEARKALQAAPPEALKQIKEAFRKSGTLANGWRTNLAAVGAYGANYLHRAGIAYGGLGSHLAQDVLQPTALADANGHVLDGAKRYLVHFEKDQMPPVRAFWSLSVYNDRQLLAANRANRYALGERDKPRFNTDGSLDLYLQREPPGGDLDANWLPTPAEGHFALNLRLYWPAQEALKGTWVPPPVRLQTEASGSRALQ